MKDRLIKRLTQLYTLELVNVFLLPILFVVFCYSREPIGINAITTMVLNGLILIEGSWFWISISGQLKSNQQQSLPELFKGLKYANLLMIGIALLITYNYPFSGTLDKIGTAFFLTLAVLEHINYFEIQLMYDNRSDINYLLRYRRLKKAKLKRLQEMTSPGR